MEKAELTFIARYANKLNASEGNLSALSKEEREHLKLLVRKYDLEQKLDEVALELSQKKLF